MGPTRKRDLTLAAVVAAGLGYLAIQLLYRYFPPITLWTGLSLLAVAAAKPGGGHRYAAGYVTAGWG